MVKGFATDAISTAAETSRADLIVMGTHGSRCLRTFLLGSVAEHVLHSSEIPVFMVRPDTVAPVGDLAIKNILCPVNDTPVARRSIGYAADIAHCFGASLTLQHVKETQPENAVSDWCAWAAVDLGSCPVQELTREGNVTEQVLAAASELNCDLLVVGARHRLLFDRTVIGSTTAPIVRHAGCPVLVVPAKETNKVR